MPNISNAARDIPQLFKADLQKDEKILWSGQPIPRWFDFTDIFLIPFSLVWGGFAFFWESSVVQVYLKDPALNGASLFMVFWGIPFVCIGCYFMFGRFFWQHWMQKNTFYALTNQRVIILSTIRGRTTQTLFLNSLPGLTKRVGKDGIGTLVFAGDDLTSRMYGTGAVTGSPFNSRRGVPVVPSFSNIKDVDRVYELIAKQQNNPKLGSG